MNMHTLSKKLLVAVSLLVLTGITLPQALTIEDTAISPQWQSYCRHSNHKTDSHHTQHHDSDYDQPATDQDKQYSDYAVNV
jgi:hypothetical protein